MAWLQCRARIFVAVLTFAFLAPFSTSAFADSHDDWDDNDDNVVLSFSTVGDSRQDPKKPDPSTVPVSVQDQTWLQNTKAWTRIMRTIQKQHSNFLFFNGDMIMGYGAAVVPADTTSVNAIVKSDLMQFYRQYGFWRGLVANLMETGTYVVPVAGNHEMQCNSSNTTQCAKSGKNAMVENENAWRANMGDLILDDARFINLFGEKPTFEDTAYNGAADSLATDQSKLSYSFDFRGSHFVVINTDPVGNDSHAPVVWLAQDLANAKARGAEHIFIFGHKPAFTYYFGVGGSLPATPSGLDAAKDLTGRDTFWSLVEQYGAVYFCGHEHIFHVSQPTAPKGKAWQVMVGSGGSPFEALPTDLTVNPSTDRDYAWATVKVYQNGKVKITAYGFDEHYGPTHVLDSLVLK